MEDVLQQGAVLLKPHKYLVFGLAASFLLHLVCAFVLLGLPGGTPAPSPSITYIDLRAAQHPAPMTVPLAETAQPKVAPAPQSAPPPETPIPAQQAEALAPETAAVPETKVEEQRSHTILGLGLTKGYFRSLGNGETLREGVKGYYLEMLQGINEKWWMDQQVDKRRLSPVVINITVARSGEIIGSEVKSSSGDSRYDRAVLAALAAASPLPPLPAGYVGDTFQAPIRLVPPLNLMAW